MKKLEFTSSFKKDWKALQKKHYPVAELEEILNILASGIEIPRKYKDHSLVGNWKGYRECHVQSNWLIIYQMTETSVIFIATGSHDDLFK